MKTKKIFIKEILHICPKGTDTIAKILIKDNGKEQFDYLVRFSIQYAKDTGKFPPC